MMNRLNVSKSLTTFSAATFKIAVFLRVQASPLGIAEGNDALLASPLSL